MSDPDVRWRRLRIVSDGTPAGTQVVDAETGDVIENVVGVTWSCRVDETAQVTLELDAIEVDLVGEEATP